MDYGFVRRPFALLSFRVLKFRHSRWCFFQNNNPVKPSILPTKSPRTKDSGPGAFYACSSEGFSQPFGSIFSGAKSMTFLPAFNYRTFTLCRLFAFTFGQRKRIKARSIVVGIDDECDRRSKNSTLLPQVQPFALISCRQRITKCACRFFQGDPMLPAIPPGLGRIPLKVDLVILPAADSRSDWRPALYLPHNSFPFPVLDVPGPFGGAIS